MDICPQSCHAAGAAYLIYNRYRYLAWLLGACLVFILSSALALFRGVGVQKPTIPEPMASYIQDENTDWVTSFWGDYRGRGGHDYRSLPKTRRNFLLSI